MPPIKSGDIIEFSDSLKFHGFRVKIGKTLAKYPIIKRHYTLDEVIQIIGIYGEDVLPLMRNSMMRSSYFSDKSVRNLDFVHKDPLLEDMNEITH